MIQRIFHPIGQGAFYSERHNNFNMVYDCGNLNNNKKQDKLVSQSFYPKDKIDLLFISHFDFDHISKIQILKRDLKIKRVVMPLLQDDEERIILLNIFRALDYQSVISLIDNPAAFFGNDTAIVYIEPSDSPDIEMSRESINIEEIKAGKIKSGVNFKYNDWIFIPFNYEFKKRKIDLLKLLEINKIEIDCLKSDLDYALTNRKILKSIYDDLDGKINQNSMIVYSGPEQDNNDYFISAINHFHDCNEKSKDNIKRLSNSLKRTACIYTGDTDLNIVNIKSIFKIFWNNVGTIQIPHHGDIKSFNKNIFKNGNYFCPISVGKNNSFGHPSNKVVIDLFSESNYPIITTEEFGSLYFQIINKLTKNNAAAIT